jgi:hypothetical protein
MCFLYAMETTDALGRRRRSTQNRGLRSLFPKLPHDVLSRLIRVAMSRQTWEHLDMLVAHSSATTKPRAYGEILEQLLATAAASSHPAVRAPATQPVAVTDRDQHSPEDWQAWQIRKELALLTASSPAQWERVAEQWRN